MATAEMTPEAIFDPGTGWSCATADAAAPKVTGCAPMTASANPPNTSSSSAVGELVGSGESSGEVESSSGEHGSGGSVDSGDGGNGLGVGLGVGGGVVVLGAVGMDVVAANGGFDRAAVVAAPVVGALSKFGAASRGGTLPMMPSLVSANENA